MASFYAVSDSIREKIIMTAQLLLAMFSFAFVTSITPGPNNLMLLASGANFGFKRTIPHMVGISMGMALLLILTLAGLGSLFVAWPAAQTALKLVGVAYLLWLAWKIASAPVTDNQEPATHKSIAAQPMRWWQAVLFQFVNPKAWMMALGSVSSFTLAGEQYLWSSLVLVIMFTVVNLPTVSVWAGFGVFIQRFLSNTQRQRYFNLLMAGLTAATVFMIVS
ncbi:LysE family translocator [Thiolinea disciformis]|uniref:LysE family translocator n=1 Tax=Thiolinea disciformis TaxID=125614 RepID=UPI00037A764B|nr:LysE family translocator [Thiolinea disciformis]